MKRLCGFDSVPFLIGVQGSFYFWIFVIKLNNFWGLVDSLLLKTPCTPVHVVATPTSRSPFNAWLGLGLRLDHLQLVAELFDIPPQDEEMSAHVPKIWD